MKMKRIIIIFFTVCIAALFTTSAFAVTEETDISLPFPDARENEFYVTQSESIRIYNQLLNSFTAQPNIYAANGETFSYPDYYGGAYINQETGKLVILVTDMSIATYAVNAVLPTENTGVTYQMCNISYNQIKQAINTISQNADVLREQGVFIRAILDDILNEGVIVYVEDLTEEKEQSIREIANYSFLRFENVEKAAEESGERNAVRPAEKIYKELINDTARATVAIGSGWPIINTSTNELSTLGFPARRNGVTGFVVAGHAAKAENQSFTYRTFNGQYASLGTCKATAFYNSSTADAAFIEAGSGITTTTETYFGEYIWGASTYLPVGTSIVMYGAVTGKLSKSIVTAIGGEYLYYKGMTIKEFCAAQYNSQKGDSGGPVMTYDGYFDGEHRYTICGIHAAEEFGGVRLFSSYANIVKELNVTCIIS